MSRSHTISIENKRGFDTTYSIFIEAPKFSVNVESWMNVWQTTRVPDNGTSEVSIWGEVFAWAGSVPVSPGPGVIVTAGFSLPASLGTDEEPGSTFDLKMLNDFPTLVPGQPSAGPGAFEIRTGTDFPEPNRQRLIGLSKLNARGQVAPVGSIAPQHNMNIQISPVDRFYVFESTLIPGEMVEHHEIIREGATIDFTGGEGQGKFFAHVVQDKDGRYTVSYSRDPPDS